MVVNEALAAYGRKRSKIMELFEYGKKRKAEIGDDKVFDFSIGNPSIPAPACVHEAIKELLDNEDSVALHGYTPVMGELSVRKAIAEYINKTQGTEFGPEHIYMSVGCAGALTASIHALGCEGDEFIVFTPYFSEYAAYVEETGCKLVPVPSEDLTFQIDFEKLEAALNPHTKAIILNSPNNPSGVVLSEQTIIRLSDLLRRKEAEFSSRIFIIADEPYRELVYDDIKVPYLVNYYDDTIVCYSFSKSLSLPGERIGYAAVSYKMEDWKDIYAGVAGASRTLGYVCASSLFQRVVAKCLGQTSDLSAYKRNRDILLEGLESAGFECAHPDGAFYLFMKSPEPDANAFLEKAKKYELLILPCDEFGCEGYVRIAYCVTEKQIRDSLPAFRKLAEEYGLTREA